MSNDDTTDHDDAPPARANQMVRRGFDGMTMAHENAATQALVAKATADIQARWLMAMKRPRDMNEVRQMIMKECKRPGFVDVAIYAVPRGANMIRGLSIRFAEVAVRCMGNISVESQTIYDSDEERIIRVTATDFETNATWPRDITVKKTVERKQLRQGQRPLRERVNSYGDRVYIVEATDDDVATKEAAAISKAARTAILRLIPGHIQDEAFDLCEKIAEDKAAKDPDHEKNAAFDAFASLNIMPTDIAQWLGHGVDRITPAETSELRKLYVSLREGEANWADALELAAARRKASAGKSKGAPKPSAAEATPPKDAAPANDQRPNQAPADDKKTTTTGKGTAAVKDKIKEKAEAKEAEKPAEQSRGDEAPAPVPPKDGYEDRECSMCGAEIEVPIGDPQGAVCYACSNS